MKKEIISLQELTSAKKYQRVKACVVLVDETKNWDSNIQKKASGKIYGLYVIDLTSPTHLCSIQINYPAYWIANHFENVSAWQDSEGNWLDSADSELFNYEHDNGGEYVSYFLQSSSFECLSVLKYKVREFKDLLSDFDDDDEKSKQKWIESLVEYYSSNSPV